MRTGYGLFQVIMSPTGRGTGHFMIYEMTEEDPGGPFPYRIKLKSIEKTFNTLDEAVIRIKQLYRILPDGGSLGDDDE